MQVVLVPTGGGHKLSRNLEKVRPLDEQLMDTGRDAPLHTSGLRPRRRPNDTGGSNECRHQGLAPRTKRTRTHDARTRSDGSWKKYEEEELQGREKKKEEERIQLGSRNKVFVAKCAQLVNVANW